MGIETKSKIEMNGWMRKVGLAFGEKQNVDNKAGYTVTNISLSFLFPRSC